MSELFSLSKSVRAVGEEADFNPKKFQKKLDRLNELLLHVGEEVFDSDERMTQERLVLKKILKKTKKMNGTIKQTNMVDNYCSWEKKVGNYDQVLKELELLEAKNLEMSKQLEDISSQHANSQQESGLVRNNTVSDFSSDGGFGLKKLGSIEDNSPFLLRKESVQRQFIERMNGLEAKNEELQQQNEELTKELAQVKASYGNLQNEIDQVEAALSRTEQKLKEEKAGKVTLQDQNQEFEEAVRKLEMEKDQLTKDKQGILDKEEGQLKELSDQKNKLAELQKYVQMLTKDRDNQKMEKELYYQKTKEMEGVVNNFATIHSHLLKKVKSKGDQTSNLMQLQLLVQDINKEQQLEKEKNILSKIHAKITNDLKRVQLVIDDREMFIPLVVNLEQEQLQTELLQKGTNQLELSFQDNKSQLNNSQNEILEQSFDEMINQLQYRNQDAISFSGSNDKSDSKKDAASNNRAQQLREAYENSNHSFINQSFGSDSGNNPAPKEMNRSAEPKAPKQRRKAIFQIRTNVPEVEEEKETLQNELDLNTSSISYDPKLFEQQDPGPSNEFFNPQNNLQIESSFMQEPSEEEEQPFTSSHPPLQTPMWKQFKFEVSPDQDSIIIKKESLGSEESPPDDQFISVGIQTTPFVMDEYLQTSILLTLDQDVQCQMDAFQWDKSKDVRFRYIYSEEDKDSGSKSSGEKSSYGSQALILNLKNDDFLFDESTNQEMSSAGNPKFLGGELYRDVLKGPLAKKNVVQNTELESERYQKLIKPGITVQAPEGNNQVCCNTCSIF